MRLVIVVVLGIFAPLGAWAAPCTLVRVEDKSQARLVVFFTKFPGEDKSEGRYKACKIVPKAVEGSETFLVTPFRPDATLVVHPSNWPK